MAGSTPSNATVRITSTFSKLTTLATALAALVLTAVIIGNILLLVFKVPTSLALFLLVDIGPVLGVFLSNIGNGGTYYGVWRVLRRAEEFDLSASTKSYGGTSLECCSGRPKRSPDVSR